MARLRALGVRVAGLAQGAPWFWATLAGWALLTAALTAGALAARGAGWHGLAGWPFAAGRGAVAAPTRTPASQAAPLVATRPPELPVSAEKSIRSRYAAIFNCHGGRVSR
jgi:hypothetical protein